MVQQQASALVASLVVLLVCLSSCRAVDLVFMDNAQYLQQQQDGGISQMDSQGLATALHALLSTSPSYAVSPKTSQQVEQLVTPNAFKRPKAVVSLQIAGLQYDTAAQQKLGTHLNTYIASFKDLAEKAFNSIATVVSSGVRQVPIDHRSFPACDDACAEAQLQAALPVIHANYTPNPAAPLTGTLSLPPADADQSPVVFDLGKDVRAKLFAVEIAHVLQAANQVQEGTLQGDSNTQDTTTILLHGSLISLQAIVHAYEGPTSRHAHAATAALLQVVRTVTERISAAYDNQVVVQVSALGNNIPLDGLRELMDWRETNTHRVLVVQQDTQGAASAEEWMTSATKFWVFFLFLVASLGSVYVMAYLKFKKDSLLFAKPKTE